MSRPSDAHVGRPAAYVDKLLIEGKGGVHHIWACDHYKTTLNAHRVQAPLQGAHRHREGRHVGRALRRPQAMVEAIMAAIKEGGLFSVDVDIIPTKIGQACHVWLPAATSGEMNLTSMNGERRMRLTERYMDPPGHAMPDCLIAARHRQAHGKGVPRRWARTQNCRPVQGLRLEDRGRRLHGRLSRKNAGAASTSPTSACGPWAPTASRSRRRRFENGKIVGTKRLYADGKFGTKDGKATFMRRSGADCRPPASRRRRTSSRS